MFLGRYNHFKCDKCETEVHLESYGLPKGWIYIPQLTGPIKHFCKECEVIRKRESDVQTQEILDRINKKRGK